MPTTLRKSLTVEPALWELVQAIAKERRWSESVAAVWLIEQGLAHQECGRRGDGTERKETRPEPAPRAKPGLTVGANPAMARALAQTPPQELTYIPADQDPF